ncbi:MAG: hypothetical protein ACOX4W_01725 [Bacilli bacterium]
MKRINIILLIILIGILTGCKDKNVEIKSLIQNEIYTQEEDRYFVYFYKDNCGYCDLTKPIILDYLKALEEKSNLNKRSVYGFDLSDSENMFDNGETEYGIFRVFEGETSHGVGDEKGNYKVNGITSWDNLYISNVPSLISITLNTETGLKESHLVAENKQGIENVLKSQLSS